MHHEWHAAKDAENRRKQNLSLRDGIAVLRDPNRPEWIDGRFGYGEERIAILGLSGHRVLLVVHTVQPAGACRTIFVRKATRHERATHRQRDARTF